MDLPISSPSEHGISPDAIRAFVDAVDADAAIEPHGLIIQRHGHRVAEGYWAPHTPDRSRLVYSLSKTFTGTALALQLGEGRLALDDLVSDHLPEYFTGADDRTKRMRIRHIASMASGHDREIMVEAMIADRDDPLRGFFTIAPDAEPGTLFAYNQPPVLALATILQRLAGERLVDYLRPRVLDPIGVGALRWTQHRPGIDLGYSGVHTNLDAIARLGQLYLDDGVDGGQRLLPEGWVADASSVQIPNPQRDEPDWRQGYGFQLWMSRHGYRGDGAFGQYMVVLPQHHAVVAMFSCTENMQRVLDLMWEHLVPAMGASALPAGPGDDALLERLAELVLPTAMARRGSGAPDAGPMTFQPGAAGPTAHRTITAIDTEGDRLLLREGDTTTEVSLSSSWALSPDGAISASATTLADGRVAADLVFLETPHRLSLVLDPSTATFAADWPVMPLFGAGVQKHLSEMRAPD